MEKFKHIISGPNEKEVSTIRFFGRVTEQSTSQFNAEFDYLETVVKPKLIRVLINSEGGSVLYGMTTYSTILNSSIPTECIIEGLAASMGSIIWAAGGKSLMRDYGILMIHNPFLPGESDENKQPPDIVKAFTKQIETIYRKRFGLKAEHIRAIMSGEADKDGTYFDAAAAVKAGIIPSQNIIHTSKQVCEKVKSELLNDKSSTEIQEFLRKVSAENPITFDIKPFCEQTTILNQDNNLEPKTTNQTMDKKQLSPEYAAVAASLGIDENQDVKDVMSRINSLLASETKLKECEKSLADAQTVIAGKDAAITNLQKDLTAANNSLSVFQQKEDSERTERIEKMIQAAITAGQITPESKADWVKMAQDNIELVEATLESIPVREKISQEIANDPENIDAALNETKSEEKELEERVSKVVGENFEFKSLK